MTFSFISSSFSVTTFRISSPVMTRSGAISSSCSSLFSSRPVVVSGRPSHRASSTLLYKRLRATAAATTTTTTTTTTEPTISAQTFTTAAAAAAAGKVPFALIGCGLPKRGMGWYHALNILEGDCPNAILSDIVEPYFMGPGKDTPQGQMFAEFQTQTEAKYGTKFHSSVQDIPNRGDTLVAMICGRTSDNPRLLKECIDQGASHIYLEKPGAPTVQELEDMANYAKSKGVPVIMGYNKNVAKYVTLAREFEAKTPGAITTLVTNNTYKEEELAECFERNAEGMMKNMAIHEIALLVTFYGVKASNIANVQADKDFSRLLTLKGPSSGKQFTDFASIGFVLTTTDGKRVGVKADRSGGAFSEAVVSVDGQVKFSSRLPDQEGEKKMNQILAADPELMAYFPLQHDDYVELKQRSAKHIIKGGKGVPQGVADIEIAIEALRVAEKLTDMLRSQLT